jgi:alpha-mannosidase
LARATWCARRTTSTCPPGAAGQRSIFSVDAPNVILETVKAAEDGSGDVILRLYEAKRMATRCKLSGALKAARVVATNMLEQGGDPIPVAGCRVELEFRPFEIKTLRVTLA